MDSMAVVVRGPQHMRALERANEVRLARAELKRGVANGEVDVADVILSSPWEARSMTLSDLLMSQRRWGRTRARRFLAEIPTSEAKTIGSLTERQRRRLAERLRAVGTAAVVPADAGAPRAGSPVDWVALEEAGRRCEELNDLLQRAIAERDAHVLALSKLGVSRREVATAAQITAGRVQQIVASVEREDRLAPQDLAVGASAEDA